MKIEKIVETMCDKYCKYPQLYDDENKMIDEKCDSCPLNNLIYLATRIYEEVDDE